MLGLRTQGCTIERWKLNLIHSATAASLFKDFTHASFHCISPHLPRRQYVKRKSHKLMSLTVYVWINLSLCISINLSNPIHIYLVDHLYLYLSAVDPVDGIILVSLQKCVLKTTFSLSSSPSQSSQASQTDNGAFSQTTRDRTKTHDAFFRSHTAAESSTNARTSRTRTKSSGNDKVLKTDSLTVAVKSPLVDAQSKK